MEIADWRGQIDQKNEKLGRLISKRAECALEIGRLKRHSAMPVYEPERERIIFENIARNNQGPLSNIQLRQVFERLVDVMRQIQGNEMIAEQAARTVTAVKRKD